MNFWVEVWVEAQEDFVPDYTEQEYDIKQFIFPWDRIYREGSSKIGFTGNILSTESIQEEFQEFAKSLFGE
jgi:hypothetical protein